MLWPRVLWLLYTRATLELFPIWCLHRGRSVSLAARTSGRQSMGGFSSSVVGACLPLSLSSTQLHCSTGLGWLLFKTHLFSASLACCNVAPSVAQLFQQRYLPEVFSTNGDVFCPFYHHVHGYEDALNIADCDFLGIENRLFLNGTSKLTAESYIKYVCVWFLL